MLGISPALLMEHLSLHLHAVRYLQILTITVIFYSGNYIHCTSTSLSFNDSISVQFVYVKDVFIFTFESFETREFNVELIDFRK